MECRSARTPLRGCAEYLKQHKLLAPLLNWNRPRVREILERTSRLRLCGPSLAGRSKPSPSCSRSIQTFPLLTLIGSARNLNAVLAQAFLKARAPYSKSLHVE